MSMVEDGVALCIAGNHDQKLARALSGRNVKMSHGLERSLEQLECAPALKADAGRFLDRLISHFVLDDGKLVVAHAGLKEEMQGRASARVREFALYGETTGESDEFGRPIRLDWVQNYRGGALVVYGHVAVTELRWVNNTVNIDTGCVFGGRLSALRYPEREIVSVPAWRTYYEPVHPLVEITHPSDDLLDVADVLGKRIVETSLMGNVTVREENATAALEVMSRSPSTRIGSSICHRRCRPPRPVLSPECWSTLTRAHLEAGQRRAIHRGPPRRGTVPGRQAPRQLRGASCR